MSQLTRRSFLKVSILATLGAALQACATATPAAVAPTKPAAAGTTAPTKPAAAAVATAVPAKPTSFKEAPMLAELVKAGKLPPVADRLPKDPFVLPVVKEIGRYGGTMHVGEKTPTADRYWREPLIQFSFDGTELGPHVFSKWEVNATGTAWTFKIREGIKWSDGTPITAEDFVYWFDDVNGNKELNPSFPSYLKSGGENGVMSKVDDYTFTLTFKAPYPLLALYLAQPRYTIAPKAYMKQFHVKYADAAKLAELTKAAKFENWFQLYNAKQDLLDNVDLPTFNSYVPITPKTDPNYAVSRNPFYFKVDPQGNQLPYIDKIAYTLLQDDQLFVTKCIAGEFDLQFMQLGWAANYPILKENESKGGYRVLLWQQSLGNSSMIMYNQSYDKDPIVAKYITDKKFRQALSVALDRDEINKLIYFGKGKKRQATVIDTSPDFKPEYATRYLQMDLAKANQWLDELGLNKKDAEGYRIAPENGQTLTLIFSVQPPMASGEAAELIVNQWKKVGVKAVINIEDNALHYQKMTANELQVSLWSMDTAWYPAWLTYAYWIVPFVAASSRIGPMFGLYRDTSGKSGTKPTGDMGKALDIFDQALVEPDEAKRVALASQVLDIAAENLWSTGTVVLPDHTIIVKNNLMNVPETGLSDWLLRTMKNGHPEQFFFKA